MAHAGRKGLNATLAAHLAAGMTVRETALTVQCAERTIYRRLKDAKFKRAVSKLRSQMVDSATGKLASQMGAASDTLAGLLASADDQVKLRAAVKTIELAVKLKEFHELEQRVKDLEKAAALTQGAKP